MKKFSFIALCSAIMLTLAVSCNQEQRFVSISGENLIAPSGDTLFIMGTNLGNWLNPEGYMFGFDRTNSPSMINTMLCQLVGPDEAADFWKKFKDNYITEEDIAFIASTGANTIRLPFHYKLFTDEDYMGMSAGHDAFKRIDALVEWCRKYGLFLILDMHDCPGGQTGHNIDDSYGYPWLFESERSQALFCEIWKRIAAHYSDEPVILGYELMNEPIASHYDKEYFNPLLEPLYKKAVAAIREVDRNHIVLLGGAQWNNNFDWFTDWTFDDKIMYTCHKYKNPSPEDAIRPYVEFKKKTGLPMYMGETGHNSYEWQTEIVRAMKANNIGYTFWPYKKIGGSCFMGFKAPEGWDAVVEFSEAPRSTYPEIRESRPDQAASRKALNDLIENVKFSNCTPQTDYINTLQMKD